MPVFTTIVRHGFINFMAENLHQTFTRNFSCLINVDSQPMSPATAKLGVYLPVPR